MRESRHTVPLLLLLLASVFAVAWARSRHARTVPIGHLSTKIARSASAGPMVYRWACTPA